MSSGRLAALFVGMTMALAACESRNAGTTRSDPNAYTLRLAPDSVAMEVGNASKVTLFASETGGPDISVRNVEWFVDNQAVAFTSDPAVSDESPTFATSLVTCRAPGRTRLTVTLGYEQKVTDTLPVTCTAPATSSTAQ
jgi:hypothetical protein